jgi:hypothetical protein
MAPAQRVRRSFASLQELSEELDRNLRHGGAFCPGAAPMDEMAQVVLELGHPEGGDPLELDAEVVFVKRDDPGSGVGLHLKGFSPAVLDQIRGFAQPRPQPAEASEPEEQRLLGQEASRLMDRLKNLNIAQQQRVARDGSVTERVALERIYGKAVWEGLLKNQRLSPPEVARIARMGTAPIAILDTIVANGAWLASGEVRRALLSNTRLGEDAILKVLRASPRHELQLVANQTTYHARVRKAAKGMLPH